MSKKATVVEVLTCARELIADPKHWTIDTLARDAGNRSVSFDNPKACKFCAMGAIVRCVDANGWPDEYDATANRALRHAVGKHVPFFNDDPRTRHEDVLAAFDKAIAAEKEKARG